MLHKGHGSNIQRGRYVELITRNRLLLFAKDVPLTLLSRHAVKLIKAQIDFLIAYAHPWTLMKSYCRL